jgi:hypothetical protein
MRVKECKTIEILYSTFGPSRSLAIMPQSLVITIYGRKRPSSVSSIGGREYTSAEIICESPKKKQSNTTL